MNYSKIEHAIAHNLPFKHGSSMSGELTRGGFDCLGYFFTGHGYVIRSYNTVIYYEPLEQHDGVTVYFNDKKYSHTTSKQQNMIKSIKGLK